LLIKCDFDFDQQSSFDFFLKKLKDKFFEAPLKKKLCFRKLRSNKSTEGNSIFVVTKVNKRECFAVSRKIKRTAFLGSPL